MTKTGFLSHTNRKYLAALVLLGSINPAFAQMAGDTEVETHPINFSTEIEDLTLADPPNTIHVEMVIPVSKSLDVAEEIGTQFIEAMFTAIDVDLSVACVTIAGVEACLLDFLFVGGNPLTFPVLIDAEVGGYLDIVGVSGPDVDVSYPIAVEIEFPAENSFACGQTITIETRCDVQQGAVLDVDPPDYNTEVGLKIDNLSIGGSIDVCVDAVIADICASDFFDLSDLQLSTTFSLPDIPPLFTVCADGVGTEDTDDLFGCGEDPDFLMGLILGCIGVDASEDKTCIGPGQCTGLPEINACFQLASPDNLDLTQSGMCNEDFGLNENGRKDDIFTACTDIISWVDFVLCPLPPPLSCTSIDLGVVSLDLGDISPEYTIDQEMDFDWEPEVFVSFDMAVPPGHGEFPYRVIDPDTGTVVSSGMGPDVRLKVGHNLEIDYPQTLSDPSTLSPAYDVESDFSFETKHHYSMGLILRLIELTIEGVVNTTLINEEIFSEPMPGSPAIVDAGTLPLDEYFETIDQPAFLLNPEKPVVNVDSMAVTDVVNIGRGERAIVYRLDLGNGGDVDLERLTLNLNLDDTYARPLSLAPPEAVCLHSEELEVNELYSGRCVPDDCVGIEDCGTCQSDAECEGGATCGCLGGGTCVNKYCSLVTSLPIDMLNSAELPCADADSVSCTLPANPDGTVEVLVRVKPNISPVLENDCFGTVDYFAQSRGTGVSPIGTCVMDRFNQCTGLDTADPIIAGVDLGASIIDGLEDYTIYGWRGVDLARAFELSRGNLGSGRKVKLLPYTAQFSKDPRIIGDVHAGGDMLITQSHIELDYMQLGGRLRMSDPNSSLTATGATNESSSCADLRPLPDLQIPPVDSSTEIDLARGEILALLPGDYAEVNMESESQLTLSSGIYNVGRLRINGSCATIRFDLTDGPVTLNLREWLMRPVMHLGFIAENGLTRDVQINYIGRKKQIFRRSVVQGTLLAPNAAIVFDDGSRLEGACYARTVKIGPHSSFTGHDFLEPLNMNSACQDAVPGDGLVVPSGAPCDGRALETTAGAED